ncbi:hypothetical protein OOZ51_00595 [Arthrobacter sp. MI7-26]|nr:hypothetical protein [Arthrobacter sp. MI7-26]
MAANLLRKDGVEDADAAFARMEKAGYLVDIEIDGHGYVRRRATILGSDLGHVRHTFIPRKR